jgi:hypothetical protein
MVYVQEAANPDAPEVFCMNNGFVDALNEKGTVLSSMLANTMTLSGVVMDIMQMAKIAGHVGMGRR